MKYWQLLKNWLSRLMIYRARVFIWFVTDLVSIAVFPFMWIAIYAGRPTLGGYSQSDIITYYFIAILIGIMGSSHLAEPIHLEIKNGDLNTLLVKPINYLFNQSIHEIAYKIVIGVFATVAIMLVSFFAPTLVAWPKSFLTIVLFCLAFSLSFVMSQLLQLSIGLGSIWLGEVSALNGARRVVETVFSGELAPLTFFPVIMQKIALWLPFPFFTFIPAQIFLGRMSAPEALPLLAQGCLWALALFIGLIIIWRRALVRYDGTGI